MRLSLLLPLLLCIAVPGLFAEQLAEGSAFSAMKILPHGEGKKVARIEARDGTPVPERWYVLVNDPKDENGLHEYVIAGGEVVASRNVSQFAEIVRPADVFGGEPLRVDSDRATKVARQYADANGVTIASMNFELKKDGTGAALLWNVTCLDESGKELGHVYLTANKGNVVSHEGFTAEPAGLAIEKFKTQATSEIAVHPAHVEQPKKPVASTTPEPTKKPDFFQRLGGSMQKIFKGPNSQ